MQAQSLLQLLKVAVAQRRQPGIFRATVIGCLACALSIGCTHSAQPGMEVQATHAGPVEYLHHKPDSAGIQRVVLAHGFLRNPGTMNHIADALAGDGIETASIALRHSKPWAGNHMQNARDMIALRKALGWERVIYAGFSAGGLSALLAAAEDPACTHLLLLDPVDHGALGMKASAKTRIPTLAILGQPGRGNANRNANRNAAGMLEAMPYCRIVELPEATHCDFEARPSSLCHRFTGAKANPDRIPEIHATIVRHSIAFLSRQPHRP